METRTDPLSREEDYTYDENGNLATVTDRKAQVTAYTYDPLDRLTLTTFDDSSTTAYTYDAGDRTTAIDDSSGGTTTRMYDDLDRLTEEETPEGTVDYTYDDAGRRATMDVSNQAQITYGYDNADRLTSITQGINAVAFVYDDANRRTSLTLPNGIVTAYGYDTASQLTSLTYTLGATQLGDLTYTYDTGGQRVAVGGSWARANLPTALASATYDAANQIATFGGVSFTYDANGSLTSDGTNTYSWNARNQLAGISGGTSASFVYDGTGRRRAKTIAGTTTGFLYDGLNPVQEQGTTTTANLLTGLGIDEYFVRTTASSNDQYVRDALGSAVALTDGSATVSTSYTYDPFGNGSKSGPSASSFLFTGRELDVIGLNYYRARYYNSRLQRFIGEDPVGFAGGDPNIHAYVHNEPTEWRDPSGEVKLPTPSSCHSRNQSSFSWLSGFCQPELAAILGVGPGAIGPGLSAAASAGAAAEAGAYAAAAIQAIRGAAQNLSEQLAIAEMMAGDAYRIMEGKINDPNFPEDLWGKIESVHRGLDGSTVTVHGWQSLDTPRDYRSEGCE